jgi:basic membrane protein A
MLRIRTVAAGLAVTVSLVAAGCGSDNSSNSSSATTAGGTATTAAGGSATTAAGASSNPAKKLKVALLVPAQANDGSFNEVALDGVKKLQDEGLIEYQLRENMADPAAAEPVIRDYASQGYDLIIGHGIELSDPIFRVAQDFPKVHFTASGGADVLTKGTANVETWTFDSNQLGYLDGFVAGKTGLSPIGIVEGMNFPFILADDAGFTAGVKAVNPGAQILPAVFVGSFDDVQKAAEATKGAVNQGAKLVFTSGDGIGAGVAAAANDAKVLTVGVAGSAGGLADKVNVATVEEDMYPIFKPWVQRVADGSFGKQGTTSTIANGGLTIAKVNVVSSAVPTDLKAQIDDLVSKIQSGAVKLPDFAASA